MTQFVPYRKPRGPKPVDEVRKAADLAEATRVLAAAIEPIAQAMDILSGSGAISFRDEAGKVWCVTIAPSDVPTLICEAPARKPGMAP